MAEQAYQVLLDPLVVARRDPRHRHRTKHLRDSILDIPFRVPFGLERWCGTLEPSLQARQPVPPDQGLADVWVANYYSARNPLRLSSLVILGVVARMFRCATRSSCWCT